MGQSTSGEAFGSIGREHRLISRMLDALDQLADRLEEETDPRLIPDLAEFVRFFTGFGEAAHHVKEEDILHPFLARHGFSWDTGPLREIRDDHDQERYFMRVLEQAAGQEEPWSREDRRHAVATMRAFIEFERAHLNKENNKLFPDVAARLGGSELEALQAALQAFDDERFGRESYEAFVALAEKLVAQYLPAVG
jgi:hemerythrin-like domain-containing protein